MDYIEVEKIATKLLALGRATMAAYEAGTLQDETLLTLCRELVSPPDVVEPDVVEEALGSSTSPAAEMDEDESFFDMPIPLPEPDVEAADPTQPPISQSILDTLEAQPPAFMPDPVDPFPKTVLLAMEEEEGQKEESADPLTCTSCQSSLRPGMRFCTTCGQPVAPTITKAPEPAKKCKSCQANLLDNALFCTTCGASTSRPVASQSYTPTIIPQQYTPTITPDKYCDTCGLGVVSTVTLCSSCGGSQFS